MEVAPSLRRWFDADSMFLNLKTSLPFFKMESLSTLEMHNPKA
jgi:hypothetical protein